MKSRVLVAGISCCGLALVVTAAVVAPGCGGISPIANLSLLGRAVGAIPRPAPDTQPGGGGGGGGENPSSICNVAEQQRNIRIAIRSESQVAVDFRITLVASAGGNGFVCSDQIPAYTAFGYAAQTLTQNSVTFGCDTVTLTQGTQLLAITLTGTLPPLVGGDIFTGAPAPLDGNTQIPIPEIIIMGDQSPASPFACVAGDPCTQGGFRYNLQTLIPASRTQATLCNALVAARPEWVVRDPTLLDTPDLVLPFQYTKGGQIIATVLNRLNTPFNQNQVVWLVRNAANQIIHVEAR
jgi:hypothetical protein